MHRAALAMRGLEPDDEKRYVRRADLALPTGKPMVAVSESGFYKLVMRSDKPEARAFQKWVTREVLPAILKTGGYRLQGVAPEAVEEGTVNAMPAPSFSIVQISCRQTIRHLVG